MWLLLLRVAKMLFFDDRWRCRLLLLILQKVCCNLSGFDPFWLVFSRYVVELGLASSFFIFFDLWSLENELTSEGCCDDTIMFEVLARLGFSSSSCFKQGQQVIFNLILHSTGVVLQSPPRWEKPKSVQIWNISKRVLPGVELGSSCAFYPLTGDLATDPITFSESSLKNSNICVV